MIRRFFRRAIAARLLGMAMGYQRGLDAAAAWHAAQADYWEHVDNLANAVWHHTAAQAIRRL